MCMKSRNHIIAILIGLVALGNAHAEQSSLFAGSQASHLTQASVPALDRSGAFNFDFDRDQRKPRFEQVQLADDKDVRVNLAMNLTLEKSDELSLRLGAVSLEIPEDSNRSLELDVRPFVYFGISSRW